MRVERQSVARRRGRAARALLLGLTLALAGACAPAAPSRPNVILIVADTLRADHMSCYGYGLPTTPNLDALAARGVLFEDCTAQASWTMTSMVSMMTGQPIFRTVYRIPDEFPVMAEVFAAAGYRTGAFVANSVLSDEAGFDRGVDDWRARQVMKRKWTARDVNANALRFLAEDDGRPFFLWLHYLDTHTPYAPEHRHWERTPEQVFTEWELAGIDAAIARSPEGERASLRAQLEELAADVDRYDSELHELDARLGELLSALERRGLLSESVVVLASDHGETLFRRPEHPDRVAQMREVRREREQPTELGDLVKREHYYWTYQELVRTPLIMAGPGLPGGRRQRAMVSNLDLLPTLAGLCGLGAPAGLPGRDLSPALRRGADVAPSPWVTSTADTEVAARLPDGTKLVLPSDDMQRRHGDAPRLYDLADDPDERHPSTELDDRGERLLEALRRAMDADPFGSWQGLGADEATLDRLRELGYVR